MSKTLDAIQASDMIFISAQPDNIYFHWQVELYLYQFAKHGIADRCYAVFGYNGERPSEYIVELSKKYNVYYYKDTRNISIPHYYIPSIRPHILKQFFKEFPELGKCVFYHDSDILFNRLPKFEEMIDDKFAYLSDTSSYINYTYISDCSKRYKQVHNELPEDDIFIKMCSCMNIPEELVKMNDNNAGGAQYLLKDINGEYWESVENCIYKLYPMLKEYESKYPIGHHIQSWTADMWVVLWEYWKLGKETRIHKELEFSWATDHITRYKELPIFHLAGITYNDVNTAFFKGNYKDSNVFEEYRLNRSIFNHVSKESSTIEYSNLIKEFVDSDEYRCTKSFIILTKEDFGGLYKEDSTTIHYNRAVWRTKTNTHLIFYNGTKWNLIDSKNESQISNSIDGIIFNTAKYPYMDAWSTPLKIMIG